MGLILIAKTPSCLLLPTSVPLVSVSDIASGEVEPKDTHCIRGDSSNAATGGSLPSLPSPR